MSNSIETKRVNGDVAVGRDVSIGGKTAIRGSATVGHNLRVEGWLEAKNIKGANKGLFKTDDDLRKAYPEARSGWWALVGDTLPAKVYMAEGGMWVATGKECGNVTVEMSAYTEALEKLTDDVSVTESRIGKNEDDIAVLAEDVNDLRGDADAAMKAAEAAKAVAEEALAAAEKAQADVDLLKGRMDGCEHDMLVTDIDLDGEVDAFVKGERPSRYRIVANVKKCVVAVGVLDIFSDSMGHQLTEVLTTNYRLTETAEAEECSIGFCSHIDGKVYRYYRFYNNAMSKYQTEIAQGSWSKWKRGSDDWTNDALANIAGGGGSVDLEAYLKKSEAEELYAKKDEIASGTTIGIISGSEIDDIFVNAGIKKT